MDAELIADLRRLRIEEMPENLPLGLEMICSSTVQSALEVRRLEDQGDTNSPEYTSVLEALKLAVGELKKYRADDGWDTEKFMRETDTRPYPCKAFPCQPWQIGMTGAPVVVEIGGIVFYRAAETHNTPRPLRTGVVGVNRDPWGSAIHESQERIIGGGLYCPTETHHRPSTKDPFGAGDKPTGTTQIE